MKFVLGLTGQTGAGKSDAASVAAQNGFFVIDCDKTAHRVMNEEKVKAKLCKVFGSDILSDDNLLDRKRLAAKAFSSPDNTELLNKTVLPFIVEEINNLINSSNSQYILLDAPTLFESGADSLCDVTVGIIADESVRYSRIVKRDNLTEDQAKSRISAGKPNDFYKQKCDYIIENNGEKQEFINKFSEVIKDILERGNRNV